jgi:DNA mismatch endonuclease (patch repair protein)
LNGFQSRTHCRRRRRRDSRSTLAWREYMTSAKADAKRLSVDSGRGCPTTADRSRLMSAVRRSETASERAVAYAFRPFGYRLRKNVRSLPGSPDLANQTRKLSVFVHGCFWHGHPGCKRATIPKRNRSFWSEKFRRNRARDRHAIRALRKSGFKVLVIWECQTFDPVKLRRRIERFISVIRD